VRQNLRRTISDVDYRSIYTSFTAIPGQGRPARPVFNPDNRSVYRDASWQVNGGACW
jgi:iron complex outermembrane receptor protein